MSSVCDIFGDSEEEEEDVFASSDGEDGVERERMVEKMEVGNAKDTYGKSVNNSGSQKKVIQITNYQQLKSNNKKDSDQEDEKNLTSEEESLE